MRSLAIFFWLLAVALALVAVLPASAPAPVARVVQAPTLTLWHKPEAASLPQPPSQPQAPMPVTAPPPVQSPVSVPVAQAAAPALPVASTSPAALSPIRPEPVVAASAAPGSCARLGLFPDQGWAESVAGRLGAPGKGEAGLTWKMQPGQKGLYVVFADVTPEMLAGRLEQRRAVLGRLVSRKLLPERCTSTK